MGGLSAADGLRSWAVRQLPAATAFSAMYLDGATQEGAQDRSSRVLAPFPLTPKQREAVSVSRSQAVSVSVHPEGATAHVERHLALRRAGWDLLGAYRSRWGERQGELLVEVANRLRA